MGEGDILKDQVISANIAFYQEIVQKYDQYESCVSDKHCQTILEADLDTIASSLQEGRVHCLDCGGGSGNLTLKMLRRGWQVTVVDVSPAMLELSKTKISANGYFAHFVNKSIEDFLASSNDAFDVVAFSSVLHHLYSPIEVVANIAKRVRPGGFFYSNFDPVIPTFPILTQCFHNLDTLVVKMKRDRQDLLPGIIRRMRKIFSMRDAQHERAIAGPGDLAEYHALRGLDDLALARTLQDAGFDVLRERYPVARTRFTAWANRWLPTMLSFKILAHRSNRN